MSRLKNLKVIAAAAVLVLVAAACGAGEVSGGGSADSAISSRGKISVSLETKGLCVKGTEPECSVFPYGGMGQLIKGEFTDSGKNAAWPYGVSMKFEGGLGISLKHDIAESAAATDCPTTGSTCWLGAFGYRSGDERHYPNVLNNNCISISGGAVLQSKSIAGSTSANGESALTRAAGEEVSRLQERMREDSKRSDRSKLATGIALMLIVDTNRNGEIDSDDRRGGERDQFLMVSMCGPYSGQPGLTVPDARYSYTSCRELGGVLDDVGIGSQVEFAERCVAPLRSGNFKIKMLPPTTTTTTTTTTTLPPN